MRKSLKKIQQLFMTVALLLILVCFGQPLPAFASSGSGNTIPSTRQVDRLVDDADLLTADEESTLLDKLDSYSEQLQMDICILTVNSRNGAYIQDFADDYYDYNGLGYGENRSGIILVLSMEDRSWALSTCGDAIDIFTDSEQEYIMDDVLYELQYDDYSEAFTIFANEARSSIISYRDSFIGNSNIRYTDIFMFLAIIVVALILPAIPLTHHILVLNNIAFQNGAKEYAKGGLNLRRKSDVFLSHHISKVAIPKENRSSGGGGGSSVHISSSGTSHGGSHGHF